MLAIPPDRPDSNAAEVKALTMHMVNPVVPTVLLLLGVGLALWHAGKTPMLLRANK